MLTLTIMMETVVQTLLNFPAQEHLAIKVRQVVCPQHKRNKTKKYFCMETQKRSHIKILTYRRLKPIFMKSIYENNVDFSLFPPGGTFPAPEGGARGTSIARPMSIPRSPRPLRKSPCIARSGRSG